MAFDGFRVANQSHSNMSIGFSTFSTSSLWNPHVLCDTGTAIPLPLWHQLNYVREKQQGFPFRDVFWKSRKLVWKKMQIFPILNPGLSNLETYF
jgi:hypothetical protein